MNLSRAKKYSLRGLVLCCLMWLLSCTASVKAQVTGAATIQGAITDSAGAAIQGAKIESRNLETGVVIKAVTNDAGLYRLTGLVPGRYGINVTATGFARAETPEVRVEVGQIARLDYSLTVGGVSHTVDVTAAALLNSETTEVGQVIDSKRMTEMPLNGRNYLQLAQLAAGVLPAGNVGAGNRTANEGGFLAFGQHTYQNNVLLDGSDNSSRASGGPLGFQAQAVKPPVDAVQEFKVLTNNTSAEFGYSTGAKVVVSTKSGTNQLHGTLYEFLRNDVFDANNFFANRAGAKKPPFKQNQFGGVVGGPIVKNKAFFFFSYQGTRQRIGRSSTTTVPSRDIKERGDFSNQPRQRHNIYDPLTLGGTGANATRQPFPNNTIPPNRWDPVAAVLIKLYPDPNIPGREHLPGNYFFAPTVSDDADQYDGRVDYYLNAHHRFFARYSYRKEDTLDPLFGGSPLPFPADGASWSTTVLRGHNAAANLTSTLGRSRVNELRFGLTHFPTRFDTPWTENLNAKFGIKNAPGDKFGDGEDQGYSRMFMSPSFASLGSLAFRPNINLLDTLTLADAFSWQLGRHMLKFGGEYRRVKIFRDAHRFRAGSFTFSGIYTAERPNDPQNSANTGNALADFLLGYASGGTYGRALGEEIVAPYYAGFIQHDWKMTPSLMLNLGLRWEVTLGGYFPNPEKQSVSRYLLPEFYGVPANQEGIQYPKDGGDCGCDVDYNNFAPRFGLAWRMNEQTVVRAGFGIYFGQADNLAGQFGHYSTGPPRANELTFPTDRLRPVAILSTGFPDLPAGTTIPANGSIDVTAIRLPTHYSQQWFLDVQRTLPLEIVLSVGYAGAGSRHLATFRNINLPLTPDPVIPASQRRRLRAEFNAITVRENASSANYHSLITKAERRFTQGFTLLSSFTWSHNIDFRGEVLSEGQPIIAYRDHYNPGFERGSSNLDRRRAFVTSFVYELPFGKEKPWMSAGPGAWIFGGWQMGCILSLLSGLPIDHTINVDRQNNGGRVRGNWVRNPNLSDSERSIDRWFDTGFVVPSDPGRIGNAGRNLINGPGRKNLDLLLARNFFLPWGEGQKLQFRFESFNLTNTPHFGAPDTAIGTPNAGRITTADEPRRIQFALKYVY
ncbi:MAG: TonB-dependent receptor [Acidobacteria bacterium]|nr:TonB-dependent receptor [Acidobacteriota bacterium]